MADPGWDEGAALLDMRPGASPVRTLPTMASCVRAWLDMGEQDRSFCSITWGNSDRICGTMDAAEIAAYISRKGSPP